MISWLMWMTYNEAIFWIVSLFNDLCYLTKLVFNNLFGLIRFNEPLIINLNGTSNPILLIHGSAGNQAGWSDALPWFKKYLSDHPIYAFSTDLPFDEQLCIQQCNPHNIGLIGMKQLAHRNNLELHQYVGNIDKYVRYIYRKHNKQVILVGHSMGGLIAHDYSISEKNKELIKMSVSISSPIKGSPLLEYNIIKSIMKTNRHHSMTPKSSYLVALNNRIVDRTKHIKYLTIGSNQDIHVPDEYARFDSCCDIQHFTFNEHGHFSIATSEKVWKIISVYVKN